MIVLRLLAVTVSAFLLAGCSSDLERARKGAADLRTFLGGIKNPDECQAPGTPQNIICNYQMRIISKVHDRLYQAKIDSDLVASSEEECKKRPSQDYPCRSKDDYYYHVYEFEIEGEKEFTPNRVYKLNNVAHANKMREGYIQRVVGNETVMSPSSATSPKP